MRRTQITIALVVALAIFEIVLGVRVYAESWQVSLALGLACGGVVGFAVIDWCVRPRHERQGARRVRHLLPVWALVPFVCALGSSAWVHYQQWNRGLRDIQELARELDTSSLRDGNQITSEKIEAAVGATVEKRFHNERAGSSEAKQFGELARVIGHDLMRAYDPRAARWSPVCPPPPTAAGDANVEPCAPDRVYHQARRDTILDFCLTLGAQALLVLWIPFLLMISIARAQRRLVCSSSGASEEGATPATPATTSAAAPAPASGLREALDERDLRILAEDRAFFVPRLCFGALLVMGTTYVFAPFGLKASYIMSLVDDHALPGHTSFALWCNNFSAAPVIVVGFVGFLIYALITATQRFVQDDLDDQAILALLVRGLIVILLSFALSSSQINGEIARLFVFIAGVFPLRGLEAIAKRTHVKIDPDFPSDGPGSFAGIPSLDPAKVFALRAAGIQSTYDLAAMPIKEIASRVRIDPRLLGRAVDRAILIDAIGPELTDALAPFAITSATELAATQSFPNAIVEKLGQAPCLAAERLARDARVDNVRRWLACTQT